MSHAQQLHNRRYLDGYMQIINCAGLPDNVKVEVCQQVHDAVLATVQWTIEQALERVRGGAAGDAATMTAEACPTGCHRMCHV